MINSCDISVFRLKCISLWQEQSSPSSCGRNMGISHQWAAPPAPCLGEPEALRSAVWHIATRHWRDYCGQSVTSHEGSIGNHFKSKSWWILLPLLFLQLWKRYLEKFVVVTQYFVSHKMISSKLLPCQCNFLCLNWDKIKYSIFSTANMTVIKI